MPETSATTTCSLFGCYKRWAIYILLLAFALRMGAAFWWQQRLPHAGSFQFADSHTYWVLGQTIQDGAPYQFGDANSSIFRTPGYPLLLAGVFQLAGDQQVLPARQLGALMGTLSVGLLMWFARLLFDERVALLTGLATAVYPGAIAMSILILSESPFCPWMIAHLICWTKAIRGRSLRSVVLWALAAGLMAGIATLVRPSWLLFTPFAALLSVCLLPQRKRQLLVIATMLMGLSLAMCPWWIRSYRITGRWVPTTLQVGASLYDGLGPNANGGSDMRFMADFRRQQRQADGARPESPGTYEDRLDQRLKHAALRQARHNPGQVMRLMLVKLRRMWSPLPNADDLQSPLFRVVVAVGFLPLLLAGLVGAVRFGKRDVGTFLCLAPAVYFTCLHMIFVSSIRYRLPAMLTLTVLAAAAMVSYWRQGPHRG